MPPTTHDFEEAFLRAKQGDKMAFEELYTELLTPVYRFILFKVGNRELAEDLTQNVFTKALEAIPKTQAKTPSPLAYLLTAARHTVIDYWRKKKEALADISEDVFDSQPDKTPSPHDRLIVEESYTEVMQAMHDLTDDQREVLLLIYLHEQTTAEVARILDKSEETVRQLKSRALKQLRLTLS